MARRYVWWPKIDEDIESMVARCQVCQATATDPRKDFSSWPAPEKPWERIHLDFAGPFFSKMWLVCIDAYSRFPYTVELPNITSTTTIQALQSIMAIEGLPTTVVTDNGTQFTSDEFQTFCRLNSIRHLTTAPFHPSSNGIAERGVRTFKTAFTKIMEDEKDRQKALLKYLSSFRSSPDPVTGKSPSELLHGRQPRNLLAVLIPESHQQHVPETTKFQVNQPVYCRRFSKGDKWADGTIMGHLGRKMYTVQTTYGICRRHQNQLRQRIADIPAVFNDRELSPNADPPISPDVVVPRRSERINKKTVRFKS